MPYEMVTQMKKTPRKVPKNMNGPGCTIKLTDAETSFVAFIMGTYVGLLLRHKGKTDRSYREARATSLRVMKKINKSAAEMASWEQRMTALRAATQSYLANKQVDPRAIGLKKTKDGRR